MENTPKMSLKDLAARSRAGLFSMSVRSIVVNVLQFVSVLALARLLTSSDYAIFGIVAGWLGTLNYFTDVGITGVLLQQKQEPTKEEYGLLLGSRILASLVLCAAMWAASSWIIETYKLDPSQSYLLGLTGVLLPLGVFSSVPRMHLLRHLEFGKTAVIDFAGSLSLYIFQIAAAFFGLSFWSFFIGMAARSVADITLAHSLAKKIVWPNLRFSLVKKDLISGFFYQLNSTVPVWKSILIPAILARFLKLEELGLLFWVQGLVASPVVFANNYNQVFLSTLARKRQPGRGPRAL